MVFDDLCSPDHLGKACVPSLSNLLGLWDLSKLQLPVNLHCEWLLSELTGSLRRSTAELASIFQTRIDMLRDRSDIVDKLRPLCAANLPNLEDLLPEPRVAVGIDGSMDYDEVLEMLLFYVAASGYRCDFTIKRRQLGFDLLNAKRTEALSASAAVPLWEEDLLNLVPHPTGQIETEVDFRRTMERIPFALMTMAELYLAWKVVSSSDIRILFLDRPFSGTYPSLYRDTAFMLMRKTLSLDGLQTKEGQIERFDLALAHVIGSGLADLPARGIYLPYAVLRFLMRNPDATKRKLAESLSLSDRKLRSALERLRTLSKNADGKILSGDDLESIRVSDRVFSSWPKVRSLALEIANRIFDPTIVLKHPLKMENGRWLSVTELNALNLFLVEALIEEAFKHKVLIIGVAKDTTATDFTRAALPTLLRVSDGIAKLPGLKSDKALLTILSTANSSALPTPWRTFAYDGCMATLIATPDADVKLRAARHTITREHLFVRCYFQLRSFQHDSDIRAPVFLYDRLFQPDYDLAFDHKMEAFEREKRVSLHLFLEAEERRSQLDDVVLLILSACDNPEVLEAYGHNQLLYLADKLVKGEVQLMKGLLKGVVDLELTPLARREKVFSIARRFRDLRAESESARRQTSQASREAYVR